MPTTTTTCPAVRAGVGPRCTLPAHDHRTPHRWPTTTDSVTVIDADGRPVVTGSHRQIDALLFDDSVARRAWRIRDDDTGVTVSPLLWTPRGRDRLAGLV